MVYTHLTVLQSIVATHSQLRTIRQELEPASTSAGIPLLTILYVHFREPFHLWGYALQCEVLRMTVDSQSSEVSQNYR